MAKRKGTRNRGKMMYVPKVVVEELENIQNEEEIVGRSVAFDKMVRYARSGRVSKRVDDLDIFESPKKKGKARTLFDGLI